MSERDPDEELIEELARLVGEVTTIIAVAKRRARRRGLTPTTREHLATLHDGVTALGALVRVASTKPSDPALWRLDHESPTETS